MPLVGRTIKLVITPVVGIFDGPLLVGEREATSFTLYATQPFDVTAYFQQTITDQTILRAAVQVP